MTAHASVTPPAILDRCESKYTIPLSTVETISAFIAPYCSMDTYSEKAPDNFYRINSLYFDTPDFLFLRQRIYKAENRFNMRIRSYGDEPVAPYYLEIKQRRNESIRKYRAETCGKDLEALLRGAESLFDPGDATDQNAENTALFCRTLLRYNARPVVLVQYLRKAFVSECDEYARVTFDIGLRYMPQSGYDPAPVEAEMIPCDEQTVFDGGTSVVLELKCYASFVPLWMIDLVRTFQLRRRGFSKYANCVRPIINRFRYDAAFFREPVFAGDD